MKKFLGIFLMAGALSLSSCGGGEQKKEEAPKEAEQPAQPMEAQPEAAQPQPEGEAKPAEGEAKPAEGQANKPAEEKKK